MYLECTETFVYIQFGGRTYEKRNGKGIYYDVSKKTKMPIYIIVVVMLISVLVAGCTFTGAKVGNQDTDRTDKMFI